MNNNKTSRRLVVAELFTGVSSSMCVLDVSCGFFSLCYLWIVVGGTPEPEEVFQSNRVHNAMYSVKSVMFSPQTFHKEPQGMPALDTTSTPLLDVSTLLLIFTVKHLNLS